MPTTSTQQHHPRQRDQPAQPGEPVAPGGVEGVVDAWAELSDQGRRGVGGRGRLGDDAAVGVGQGEAALAAVAGDRDAVLDTAEDRHPAVQPAVVDEVERRYEEQARVELSVLPGEPRKVHVLADHQTPAVVRRQRVAGLVRLEAGDQVVLVVRRRRGGVRVEDQGTVVVAIAEDGEADDQLDLVAGGKFLELLVELWQVGGPDVDHLLREQDDLRFVPCSVDDQRLVPLEDRWTTRVGPACVVGTFGREYGDLHRLGVDGAVEPYDAVQAGAHGNHKQCYDRYQAPRRDDCGRK
jgi:hypothetical protein